MPNIFFLKRYYWSTTILLGFLFGLTSFLVLDNGVTPEKYLEIYQKEKSKFEKRRLTDEIHYALKYIPQELKLISLEKKGAMNQELFDEFKKDGKNYHEFLMQLSIPSFGAEFLKFKLDEGMTYEERLNYYSFEMKKDIKIIIDKDDTLFCSSYTFERNFGASPNASFSIGFELPRSYNQLTILVDDKVFGNEHLSFDYLRKDIKVLPTLKNYKKWKN